jgi:hypothetical protein
VRRALENLFAFLLRHAPQHAELLSLRLQLLEIGESMEYFLLRFVADRASVVKNQVSLLDGLHLPVSFLHQRSNDFFRVVDVHLAPEGFQVKSLLQISFRHPRHIKQV